MDDLLAESQRLEDEARALAGLPPRDRPASSGEGVDSVAAVLRDAGQELRTAAAAALTRKAPCNGFLCSL